MKKRSYRAQKVNEVRWEEVADRVKERTVVWAMDVAKVEQYGVLMDSERQVVVTVKWTHRIIHWGQVLHLRNSTQ